jgi:serine/threonine protein kinase
MSAPSTADEFLELTSRSGLLESTQLRVYREGRRRGALPDGAQAMADVLVGDGVLTRFHVEQLLRGKWRNFILSGKYKVLGPLGSGGMGQVYLCEHQVMRRRVAVKVLPEHSGDAVALERFRREARAVAALDHPNIVRAYDIDRDGKLHFLVMEYIDGNTLSTIVKRRGPMDVVRAAHYVRQAALGLQHAHEAGLVHRDVKPSNLVLERSGTLKILDLGLARFFHDQSDDLSRRHGESPLGTMDYMAPEQAMDSHVVDIRADIYGLGSTFYFLLAGHGPFGKGTHLQKLMCHPLELPEPIRAVRPEVPEGLAAVIGRMMAREPADRYPTPGAVAGALGRWTQAPVAPPPLEEMPELMTPLPGARDPVAGPALPAFLYESATPHARSADAGAGNAASTASQRPTAPIRNAAVQPRAPARAAADSWPRTTPPGSGGERAPPSPAARRRHRGLVLVAAAALLLLGASAAVLAVHELTRPSGHPAALGTAFETAAGREPSAVADSSPQLRLLVPAYYYPADEGLARWEQLLDSPAAATTVIIANPDSGPGKAQDANYVKVLARAREKGVTVIGYVSTKYASRPLADVKADVDRWMSFYPDTRGIFFDEQASAPAQVLYYAPLYDHARNERHLSLVVSNPGTQCAETYLERPAADVVCLVEARKDFTAYRRPAWANRYTAGRFAALLCNVGTAERMRQAIVQMRAEGIGYCFVTDADEPNPWGRLPGYWEEELEAVREANTR